MPPGDQAYIQKRCHFSQGKDSVRPPVHVPAALRVYAAPLSGVWHVSPPRAPEAHARELGDPPTAPPGRTSRAAPASAAPCRLREPSRAPRGRASATGLRPGAQLPLGDIKAPADGWARRRAPLGLPVADQVLEERAAGQQARRQELQQQGQQESGGQGEPHDAQGAQRPQRRRSPGSHGRAASALPGPRLQRAQARPLARRRRPRAGGTWVTRREAGTRSDPPGTCLPGKGAGRRAGSRGLSHLTQCCPNATPEHDSKKRH